MRQTEPPCFTTIQKYNGSPDKDDWNLTHDDLAPNSLLLFTVSDSFRPYRNRKVNCCCFPAHCCLCWQVLQSCKMV